ncbi:MULTISPECIES: alanine dehydrogenase [Chryseobacterium]|jgi:Alanine dehydrogenase|uniref:alanine dehydrogenase n=1 Tax=Chryseobacterium rhizosphaerae TaxID=395937 RepID=A0AAE3Y666_9FLAO|nr:MULTISPECIES: alanine dehydrogenase [Chryseobacterium]MBL3546349.1 alanine dehydrogenase [Chryseobacterium sp. KMC2]MDC8101103.1 alanine dehydrogenase [Chryseobacterium rhizosphaerae]MDR6526138.1 alanine dehydrogenase [Chryseobacterium rhizosphaerae]MDR6545320.1 alanine dehydrogenase [Chryseobacterium rhizosphaerae]REC75732.1 alanine dehydrogenase [Chryseobacterium rhizosphaerae]
MSTNIFTPFTEEELMPKEEKLEVIKKGKQFSIGIPKETCLNERRTCITPDAVQVLVEHGHEIIIESGAGQGSFFTDLQYSESGARITNDPKEAFGQDLILKVNPPTEDEIEFMKPNTYLVSALQINLREKEYFLKLAEKKINAIAFEFIVDEYKQLALVRLIGEIAGSVSILYASELLALSNGLMLGGITGVRPAEVVVLGAGIVGEFATKAAIGLGASVKVFDNSLSKLRRLHTIVDSRVPTSIIDPKELSKSLRRADVVIGALPRLNMTPIVTEDMVMKMKKGSVIIDITIDNGKVIETSELTTMEDPYIIKHGVIHCGLPNLTSRMPRTTTKAISNFFLSYILNYDEEGGFENMLIRKNEMKQSLYMYKGRHTKKIICDRFGLTYHDINLLIF